MIDEESTKLQEDTMRNRFALANIALAFPPLVMLLADQFHLPAAIGFSASIDSNLPPYQRVIIAIAAYIWLPALLTYLVLTITRLGHCLRTNWLIHVALGLPNCTFVMSWAYYTWKCAILNEIAFHTLTMIRSFIIPLSMALIVSGFTLLVAIQFFEMTINLRRNIKFRSSI